MHELRDRLRCQLALAARSVQQASAMSFAGRILVVEDDASTREGMAALLRDVGYDVVTAGDGVEALTMVARESPDLVITDHRMPRMDGRRLVAHLKTDPVTQRLPVIVVSADEPASRIEGPLCADAYFGKPIDIAELTACIDVQLRRRRS